MNPKTPSGRHIGRLLGVLLLLAGMLLAGALWLLATPTMTGRMPTAARAIPSEAWRPVQTAYKPSSAPTTPEVTPVPTLAAVGPTRPRVAVPTPGLVVVEKPSTKPPPISSGLAHELAGHATWYCLPGVSACMAKHPTGGMYAAAGPELRHALGPDWRSKIVETCLRNDPGRCVRVKLSDWCACSGDHTIDLYSTPFKRLAPLSRGIIEVSIRW